MNNKSRKELIIAIIIVIVTVFVGGFVSTKVYYINKYTLNYEANTELKNALANASIKKLTYNASSNKEKLVSDNMSIYGEFTGFDLSNGPIRNGNRYLKQNENKETTAFVWLAPITKEDTYTYLVKSAGDLKFMGNSKPIPNIKNKKEYLKYVEQKNITSDLELLKYLKDDYNKKNTIFTKTSEMKNRYNLQLTSAIIFANRNKKVTFLEGTYPGFVLYGEELVDVFLYKDNKPYFLEFYGFSEDEIFSMVETVTIN